MADKKEHFEFWLRVAQRLYKAKQTNTINQELKKIEDEYGKPDPTSFINGDFDPGFLNYFTINTYTFWNPANADKSDFSTRIFYERSKIGEFSIIAWPYIEGWNLIGKADRRAFLVLATGMDGAPFTAKETSYYDVPKLQFMATSESQPFHYSLDQPIAALYPLDFYDYDGDGKDEIGFRYEITGADGFWQELVIFKVDGRQLKVLKKFNERTSEGIIRRIGNIIEIGNAFGEDVGHLSYDKYHIEKYQYMNGDFQKVGEAVVPHILLSDAWKNYFLVK